jgi:ribose 5-phosphate isomerase A
MSEKKLQVAKKAVEFVENGMVLGLGTGSTTKLAVDEIGKLVKNGYKLVGIPTSIETEKQARSLGIPLTTLDQVDHIDLTIDGADEVDPKFRLIKGLGGALLREKIVAYHSRREIIIVDDSKLVDTLGIKTPLPVEVVQFNHLQTKKAIEKLGCVATLRGGSTPFITDNYNVIYDCKFQAINEPEKTEMALNSIPGVVENGLFLGLATCVVVGTDRGTVVKEKKI